MGRAWASGIPLVLCCAFLFRAGTAVAAVEQPKVAESGKVVVTADTADVRESPSRRAGVVTVVERGEVFEKLGRTRGWYLIRIDEETTGWVSGRAIRRYRSGIVPGRRGIPAPRYDLDYPGVYYEYPYDYWGEPYYWWEWGYYGYGPSRSRTWDGGRDRRWDRERSRPLDDGWREDRPRGGGRLAPGPGMAPRPIVPRVRPPGPRR